ncbi:MAG: GNAT family N-acetyltransferase [Maritimibacter sp.]|nr:GNAT family N-acetyltransferase [Maritimibacter sp.]
MPTQAPEWTDCICSYAAYRDASRYYRFANGQEIVVPLVRRSWTTGSLAIRGSLPFAWGYGGLLSRYPVTPDEAARVVGDLGGAGFSLRVCPNPTQAALWRGAMPKRAAATARRCHILDIEGGFEAVWRDRFLGKTRRKIAKAQRLGVQVTRDTTGEAAAIFYELYRRSLERWAVRQNEPLWLARRRAALRDPRCKILHIARFMGEACRVWVASHEGRPVAASLVLVGRNADDIMCAMDKDLAAPINANDLLLRHSIEDACQSGCTQYHFGESGTSVGLAQFKERFGAVPVAYEDYRLERVPMSRAGSLARAVVKKAIGFKD